MPGSMSGWPRSRVHLISLIASVGNSTDICSGCCVRTAKDAAVFVAVKRRTRSYREKYVEGVERSQRRVAYSVDRPERLRPARLFDRTLRDANLAPMAGVDPAPEWVDERARRWHTFSASNLI